jgi:hypothetical protein
MIILDRLEGYLLQMIRGLDAMVFYEIYLL